MEVKIIQINASYKPDYVYGGPALSVSRLCEGLVRHGAHLEVLTTTANGNQELPVKANRRVVVDNVPVTYFKRLTKDHTHFSPDLFNNLRQRIKDLKQQPRKDVTEDQNSTSLIIHIHAWWNLVSIFSCLIAKLYKVPVILTPRGTLSNYSFGNRNAGIKNYIHRFLGKRLLEYCHIHVTSEKERNDILKLVKPRSITVIPNFVYLPDINTFKSITPTDKKQVKLLFLSRIEQKKGLEMLFKALAQINLPFELNIAGTGETSYIDSLKSLASELKIADNLNWLGQKDQEEKWLVMQNHDMLILPSYDENFANVVIECLATGTPVVVTDKVGLADYVQKKGFGWICTPNVDSIKKTLIRAFEDKSLMNFTRENAPLQIRNDFDEDTLIKDFLNMYSNILSK